MEVYEQYRGYQFLGRRIGKDVQSVLPGKTLPILDAEKLYDVYKLGTKAMIMGPLDENKSHASATVVVGEC